MNFCHMLSTHPQEIVLTHVIVRWLLSGSDLTTLPSATSLIYMIQSDGRKMELRQLLKARSNYRKKTPSDSSVN